MHSFWHHIRPRCIVPQSIEGAGFGYSIIPNIRKYGPNPQCVIKHVLVSETKRCYQQRAILSGLHKGWPGDGAGHLGHGGERRGLRDQHKSRL